MGTKTNFAPIKQLQTDKCARLFYVTLLAEDIQSMNEEGSRDSI